MNRIKMYVNTIGRGTQAIVLALAVIFISAGIAQAATTISTNVTTAGSISTTGTGTLSIAGLATFLGGATTTEITLLSGDTIKNASASSTVLSADLTIGSGTTGSGDLTILNNGNAAGTIATSTLSVGCILTTATSSATRIRIMFNTQATTSITGTASGTVVWGYGTTCP